MGSLLDSEELGGVWWLDLRNLKHIDRLRLARGGLKDAESEARIRAFNIDVSYEPFRKAVLQRDDFGHVALPYDWRKPLDHCAAGLREKIVELHAANKGQPIHLVAHSMGGLVVRAALRQYGPELWPRVGRIAFIATPHYGAPAIAGYLKNHLWGWEMLAALALYLSRETFRSLWGVLDLLPAPRGVYPGTRPGDSTPSGAAPDDPYVHPCANFDLYQVESWKLFASPEQQQSLELVAQGKVAEWTQAQQRFAEEQGSLQEALDAAAAFHWENWKAHQPKVLKQEYRDRMAVIAGVGYKTLFRLAYRTNFWGWETMDKEFSRIPGDPHRDGDGRVPVASAALENVGDIRYVKGKHHGLPNIPAVYDDVFRWLKGEPMQLPRTPAQALATHLAGSEGGSEAPHLDGTASESADPDDPGYWDLVPPSPERMAELQSRIEAGQVPQFLRVRLL
jgi:pimeloyl-ACP methyl ester carboxylesterase